MNARLRFLAALLALFGLSAYFAESIVAASACPPGMETGSTLAGAMSGSGPHAGMPMHGTPDASSDDPEQTGSEVPPCPLGMAGTGSSCVAASLPAMTTGLYPTLGSHQVALLFPDDSHDLLLIAAHFRPPRA